MEWKLQRDREIAVDWVINKEGCNKYIVESAKRKYRKKPRKTRRVL